ncbi:MAG: ATP-dependent helicase Lhr and Lhr-like helicase [Thermoanaerobaculia bacterium]|nr:ATP-dependent helicase Lhr and Lhr-like helicase [Thermoanaerobaculia bacterium]
MAPFHPAVRDWFLNVFRTPTRAQEMGWPAIARGDWTLIFAPTGSGKTLTAFLWALDRLMFAPRPEKDRRCRVVYISPLKALAVDVERNLRAPLTGIANLAAERGESFVIPSISIRTGDTPQAERARFLRDPADILITTPESIYLMLTSNARDVLRGVETIIIDEVHALVPNKRGAHMALSLERLQRIADKTPQRIGLSATQNPLEEVAKYLGGFEGVVRRESGVGEVAAEIIDRRLSLGPEPEDSTHSDSRLPRNDPRAVTIINTGEKKQLTLHVEVPVEEMAKLNESSRDDIPSGPAGQGVRTSIWPAIHPRLLELIRAHTSTLIFVNSRRLAERLAGALNELAGELLVQAHHGSIARAQRIEIEDNLKSGRLPALVATSSLELGIDMGAIDLVIQIEAPPSIASGMQRIGRASHQVGTVSEGIIFPKFRGDLLACAAVTDAMHRSAIEPTRYPRNPLDVLAQQIVAMIAVDSYHADELFALVRQAAPFSELSRTSFDGVLDMLSGLYPSDEFAELRPRITWDRVTNILTPRPNAKRVAITSGGTIPDRGLFGVFLAGGEKTQSARVGELDEEMVFESRVGETFLLGASTWRIEEITHDRVLVTPAPGEPGKMPFWKADAAERTVPFGEAIGALVREIGAMSPAAAVKRLTTKHDLGELAARNFIQYLDDQHAATGAVPDDRTIVIERVLDDLGDWRVCVLTPFGGRIHAPWAMAVTAKVRNELQIDVETMWSDDGFIVRFPDTDVPPRAELLIPDADEIEQLVVRQLGSSSMFAAKFREAAARALLLPRFRPDRRQPLWQQRKRAYDLLQVASRFGSFPIILETYREVLRDVFDVPALVATMKKIQQRTIRVVVADTEKPSPFAGSLLFRYVANFIYDGDAPLAERRAQALAIDQAQLRELLGEPELRELLDADALHALEIELQHLDDRHKVKSADALHDLLLRLGDLSREEIAQRSLIDAKTAIRELTTTRRIIEIGVAREKRFIAIEDASRYRDALGAPLPQGLADRYLQPMADPTGDLVLRYARTHGPFTPSDVAHRYGLGVAVVRAALERFVERGRLIEGEFRPGGTQREWCDNDVLSAIRRRSLAKLRKEVEPVDSSTYVRLITHWQFVTKKRRGLEGLLEVVEALQGVALPASIFESEILSSRIEGYKPSDLDTLSAAGEIVWTGVEPLGERDGRIALYLTDHLPLLHAPRDAETTEVEQKIIDHLRASGASFFAEIQSAAGGFANDVVDALWNLVWRGVITNDTFHALRAYTRPKSSPRNSGFRSRRVAPPSTQGRWSLVQPPRGTTTERASATAHQLLARYGVVVREAAAVEGIPGGFSAIYPILKGMEESGRTRRGYFVAGFGATQFGSAGALDLLRSYRDEPDEPETAMLAATDPANPYGSLLKWPVAGLMRVPGASVILVNGLLSAYIGRGEKQLSTFLPENEPMRGIVAREIAKTLASLVANGTRRALLIAEVNGAAAAKSDLGSYLAEAGFVPTAMGYQMRAMR